MATTSAVDVRPADLYVTQGVRQPGVVLVGDAFATSCPAAGTGTSKVFTDVERLCNVYIPRWFARDGMAADKIGAFYDYPVKRACEAHSGAQAHYMRAITLARCGNRASAWRCVRRSATRTRRDLSTHNNAANALNTGCAASPAGRRGRGCTAVG